MSAPTPPVKKKDARQLAKEAQEAEKAALLKEKMDAAGLSFVDNELPPDEVDKKDVAKSLLYSFRSMIPGTSEYFEAQQAEIEMDDLANIRIEKAKATDFLAMTKLGRHEEALEKMMAETNNDFFFFNKLKFKMEEEGKWEYEKPKADLFNVGSIEARRNRIRKAFRATFNPNDIDTSRPGSAAVAEEDTDEEEGGTKKKGKEESTTCAWRGKSKDGKTHLQCNNKRYVHPHEKVIDSETKKQVPLLLANCAYHMADCVEKHDLPVKIKTPNPEAYCSECYMMKKKGQKLQDNITMATVPGTCEAVTKTSAVLRSLSAVSSKSEADAANARTEDSICEWKAAKGDVSKRGFVCTNCVIKHPETGGFQRTCGMHVTICLRKHTGSGSNEVTVPNIYGLCVMHHTAEHGNPPVEVPFPYPGMRAKKAKNEWMRAVGHWAAPRFQPGREQEIAEYEPPDEPEDFIQAVILAGNRAKYLAKKRRLGKISAVKIQSVVRRWRLANFHKDALLQLRIPDRIKASIVIQQVMRGCLGRKRVRMIKHKKYTAAICVQKRFRGYKCRKQLKRRWAERRIFKFIKKLRFFKFRDTVIVMMQLRRMFRRLNENAVTIQRIARGYTVRRFNFESKLYEWVRNRSAKVITRSIIAYIKKLQAPVFVYPTEAWALRKCSVRLANLLWKLLQLPKERMAHAKMYQKNAPSIQKIVRGFLCRRATKKMRFLRKVLRGWVKPEYAYEYLRRFYESNVFYLRKDYNKIEEVKEIEAPKAPVTYLRPFLPEERRKDIEVENHVFMAALKAWYSGQGVPLLSSEADAICKTFSNPASRRVEIAKLEDFMALSELPCRKHGRIICGDCFFFGNCRHGKCSCKEYSPAGGAGSVCKDCFHPPSIHRICPLAFKEKKQKKTMLTLMRAKRTPDTSIPEVLRGITIDDSIIPPPDPDDIQLARIEDSKAKSKAQSSATATYRLSSLDLRLTYQEEKGEDIATNKEYWGQFMKSMLMADSADTLTANIDVSRYEGAPDLDLTEQQFWDITSKNPNKSRRDYDEKFEHNMPMPVVDESELLYTFEGSKVYLNILVQLIIMEFDIDYDNANFLRLIVDHIQVFERHWRKMVRDLREGVLSRTLMVPLAARAMYEAMALPRPALAKNLDKTFRKLGFHKKVLGKDIKGGAFAEKKVIATIDPRGRRPSLPMTPSGTGLEKRNLELRGISRDGSAKMRTTSPSGGKRTSSSREGGGERSRSRSGSPVATSRSPSRGALGSRSGGDSRERETVTTPGGTIKKLSRREKLLRAGEAMRNAPGELNDAFEEQRVRGPSRRSRGDSRRNSDVDAYRPADLPLLQAMHYSALAEPRESEHLVIGGPGGDRFICPFPACGASFRTKELAFAHLPKHEQRMRLSSTTALPDSHLNFYWPTAVPWLTAAKYTERGPVPGSLPCTFAGCEMVFPNKARLAAHVRIAHGKQDPAGTANGYFKMLGEALNVPPYSPPENLPVLVCARHNKPDGSCMRCIQLEKLSIPKPPLKFYEGVTIDMSKMNALATLQNRPVATAGKTGGEIQFFRSSKDVTGQGVVYLHLPAKAASVAAERKHAQVVGMLVDNDSNGWLGVNTLLHYDEAHHHSISVPRDMDKQNELVFGGPRFFKWIQLDKVQGSFPLLRMSKEEYTQKRKAKQVSKSAYFVRERVEEEEEEGDGYAEA